MFQHQHVVGVAMAILACVTALAPAQAHVSAPTSCSVATLASEMENLLDGLVSDHGYPGFAYAVEGPDDDLVSGGTGVSDRDSEEPMRGDTIFQIGSITKTFIGAVFARLVAEDRIGLGDPLADHWFDGDRVPAYPNERPITLQEVATHTAGLPRYPDNLDREDGDPILGYSVGLMREALASIVIEDEFPLAWSYSNFGYGVLAQALSRSQGRSLEQLLVETVVEPVGLADTTFSLNDSQHARLATPYRDDDITVATQPWRMESLSAAGGLFSTAQDLATFGAWLLADHGSADVAETEARLLQQAPFVRLSRANTGYGLGLFIVEDYIEGVDVNWHGGDVDGYAGSLVLLPDHGVAIAYLTNIGFARGFAEFQRIVIERAAALCGRGND